MKSKTAKNVLIIIAAMIVNWFAIEGARELIDLLMPTYMFRSNYLFSALFLLAAINFVIAVYLARKRAWVLSGVFVLLFLSDFLLFLSSG